MFAAVFFTKNDCSLCHNIFLSVQPVQPTFDRFLFLFLYIFASEIFLALICFVCSVSFCRLSVQLIITIFVHPISIEKTDFVKYRLPSLIFFLHTFLNSICAFDCQLRPPLLKPKQNQLTLFQQVILIMQSTH